MLLPMFVERGHFPGELPVHDLPLVEGGKIQPRGSLADAFALYTRILGVTLFHPEGRL